MALNGQKTRLSLLKLLAMSIIIVISCHVMFDKTILLNTAKVFVKQHSIARINLQ